MIVAVLHAPECIDPVEKSIARYYGIPHDATTCDCRCHETVYADVHRGDAKVHDA